MKNLVNKTVNLNLVGENGNAFNLIAVFRVTAKKQGWTNEEIKLVEQEATKGDYDHLLATLLEHTNVDEFEPEEDEYIDLDEEY